MSIPNFDKVYSAIKFKISKCGFETEIYEKSEIKDKKELFIILLYDYFNIKCNNKIINQEIYNIFNKYFDYEEYFDEYLYDCFLSIHFEDINGEELLNEYDIFNLRKYWNNLDKLLHDTEINIDNIINGVDYFGSKCCNRYKFQEDMLEDFDFTEFEKLYIKSPLFDLYNYELRLIKV
uniref:Uncharacterized protein n=1 Tax=Pithovirus LCDPAC02 TaxID=2506601 RepID=A0A481YPZ2_9VIRU|nr:MAG: hypothetical protein LCDPAC02_00540 [Pithovirus LCDPAC02]